MINNIESYNPEWKKAFERIKQFLEAELIDLTFEIIHVGSTAIPGLCAKPILDIDLVITNKSLLGEISKRLERLGYINKGEQGIPGRFAFRLTTSTVNSNNWQAHHIYVCYSDSLALKNHLVFKDILQNDKKVANEYSHLKIFLAEEEGMTREKYTEQKTDFILSALALHGLEEKELGDIKKANT